MKTETVLTGRDERFIWALAMGMKPTPAAVAAGFSEANGRHLIRRPALASAIKACSANLARTVAMIEAAEQDRSDG